MRGDSMVNTFKFLPNSLCFLLLRDISLFKITLVTFFMENDHRRFNIYIIFKWPFGLPDEQLYSTGQTNKS